MIHPNIEMQMQDRPIDLDYYDAMIICKGICEVKKIDSVTIDMKELRGLHMLNSYFYTVETLDRIQRESK